MTPFKPTVRTRTQMVVPGVKPPRFALPPLKRPAGFQSLALLAKGWLDDLGMTPASLMKSFRAQELNGAVRFLFLKNHSRRILLTEADANRKGSICLIFEEIPGPLRALTPRQLETHYWLSRGKSKDQIATLMKIKVCTVRKHLEKTFELLGGENRTAAAWFGHYRSFILAHGAEDSQ
jgi:DNA-binding CsgD family transcriptional regulator